MTRSTGRGLVLAAVASLALVSIASAQEDAAPATPTIDPELQSMLEHDLQKDNTLTYAYFPAHQDAKFPVGELSTVIAGVRVKEPLYGKLSCYGIKADIGMQFQASSVIQNFTYAEPFFTVMQAKDKTLHLKVMPAKELAERKFFLTVYVLCKYLSKPPESAAEFAQGLDIVNVAFNETVELVDTSNAFDGDFFTLVGLLGFMGFVMLYAFTDLLHSSGGNKQQPKQKPKKKVETGTVDANGDEWLEGTYAAVPKKKK